MKRLLDILFALSHPSHWGRNYQYNAEWDALVNEAITNGTVRRITEYRAEMGNGAIWIGGYPFAYGYPYIPKNAPIMPARRTVKRLRDHINSVDMAEVRATYEMTLAIILTYGFISATLGLLVGVAVKKWRRG